MILLTLLLSVAPACINVSFHFWLSSINTTAPDKGYGLDFQPFRSSEDGRSSWISTYTAPNVSYSAILTWDINSVAHSDSKDAYNSFSVWNHQISLKHSPWLSNLSLPLILLYTCLLSWCTIKNTWTLPFFVSGKGPNKSNDTICPERLGNGRG